MRRVLWVVLLVNLAVAVTKFAVGWIIGSLALSADAVHSVLDASANVIGLVGMGIAAKPPDASHPYGHRRFEAITGAIIGLLIAIGLLEILHALWTRLQHGGSPPEVDVASLIVVLLTVFANLLISRYERREGETLRSSILTADASHTFVDAVSALVVLLAFVAIWAGLGWADLLAALLVCVFIALTAYRVLRSSLSVLSDELRIHPEAILDVVMHVEGVAGAHKIRSRGSPDHVHVDLHVHLDPHMSLVDAHQRTHIVADAIRKAFPEVKDVIIHTEPADGREDE